MNFQELLLSKEYDFLRSEPRLGDRIMLLGISGSYGSGTNREGSDVDFRGVTLNLPSDLIGLTTFEQFEHRTADTVLYSFNMPVILDFIRNECLIQKKISMELSDDHVHNLEPLNRVFLKALGFET